MNEYVEHSPYYLGALAHQKGELLTDNPYPLSDEHNQWALGWTQNHQQSRVKDIRGEAGAARVIKISTRRFNAPSSLRLLGWSVVLRLALFLGHPVVLIGACRMGKTLLLRKLTPDQVIDKRDKAIHGKRPVVLTESDVPNGIYSLDECQLFEPSSIAKLTTAMAAQNRAFCLAAQRYTDVKQAADAYRLSEGAKQVLLVVVGGEQNPPTILRELPQ